MNTSGIIITAEPFGVSAVAECLSKGEYLKLEENHIIANKHLTLSFRKACFDDGDVIRLGHGEGVYSASYLELTKTSIRIYEQTNDVKLVAEMSHGLTLGDYVSISVDVGYASVEVALSSAGGAYHSGVVAESWSGRNGAIFAVSTGSDISDVKMHWHCSDYQNDIWLFGDSYFNPVSPIRWTSYMISDGYTENLLSGYPGRDTASALKDFKQALTHGKPKYAVWCMGMNDADTDTEISTSYLNATEEFLRLCELNGIAPILSTIPCVPERSHVFKNEWVRSTGLRYVDFAKAVGGEKISSSWYADMLSSDNVHPDALGARALYAQFLKDFPEIMNK